MKAVWNNALIAESDDTVVVEGNYYFPLESVNQAYLQASDHTSFCGWKGTANYYHINVAGKQNSDAAWYYAEPLSGAKQIAGRVAFWRGVVVSE